MAATIDLPKIDIDFSQKLQEWTKELRGWNVILYNDNFNTKDEVTMWLQKATGCSLEVAEHVMTTAHHKGRAICFSGGKEKCQEVAGYLRGKGLQVEVDSAQ
jgi:ATP-dependent Clp protease adapter protein ClpS|eukprot:TRINITY_DN86658_c0_g1_i1.p1 TRINITY_DN86658_c0_g1~~TRINITY_DN86658_c0_g1_i1.p1  ORF type:complete len:102 (-),score=25.40 TRINITY_DN86658_c0_g1_i1:245-550(-)